MVLLGWFYFCAVKTKLFKHIYKSEGFSDGNFEPKSNMYRIGHYVFQQLIWAHLHRHLHRVRASRWLVGYHDRNYPDAKAKIRAAQHAIVLGVVYNLRKWLPKQIYFLCSFLFFCMLCGNHSVFPVTFAFHFVQCEKSIRKKLLYIRFLHIQSTYFTKCFAFLLILFQCIHINCSRWLIAKETLLIYGLLGNSM